MSNYKKKFKEEIVKTLQEKLKIKNKMAVPCLQKIVVSASGKEYLGDRKNLEKGLEEITQIAGQKPKITRAKVSVATFKLREGDTIGIMVTLRGNRMYDFFEKLVTIVLPRVRDFAGVNSHAFDGNGNLNIGFGEMTVFPEIDPGKVERVRSVQMTIVTTAKNDADARVMFETMGMPFKKN